MRVPPDFRFRAESQYSSRVHATDGADQALCGRRLPGPRPSGRPIDCPDCLRLREQTGFASGRPA